jgi:hypothetical protein
VDSFAKFCLIVIRYHARSSDILLLVVIKVLHVWRLLVFDTVIGHGSIVGMLSFGFQLPRHGKVARFDQMSDHFQSFLEIRLRLLQLGLERLERPVAEFAEALEDTVQKLVLRHTNSLVFLDLGLGRFELLLRKWLESEYMSE